MATEPKSRRRRRKKILRKNDGSLYDATERRRITHTELRDYVRDGGLFEARRQEGGADCTYEVLQSVMGVGLLENWSRAWVEGRSLDTYGHLWPDSEDQTRKAVNEGLAASPRPARRLAAALICANAPDHQYPTYWSDALTCPNGLIYQYSS